MLWFDSSVGRASDWWAEGPRFNSWLVSFFTYWHLRSWNWWGLLGARIQQRIQKRSAARKTFMMRSTLPSPYCYRLPQSQRKWNNSFMSLLCFNWKVSSIWFGCKMWSQKVCVGVFVCFRFLGMMCGLLIGSLTLIYTVHCCCFVCKRFMRFTNILTYDLIHVNKESWCNFNSMFCEYYLTAVLCFHEPRKPHVITEILLATIFVNNTHHKFKIPGKGLKVWPRFKLTCLLYWHVYMYIGLTNPETVL